MKLLDEWRKWYALYSVQINTLLAVCALIQANWGVFSLFIPDWLMPYVVALLALAAIAGRFIPQPKVIEEAQEKALVVALKKESDASL